MSDYTLKSELLTARITAAGAELNSLQSRTGKELIWQADPAIWPRHAPVLFPIVGRLKNDQLIHQGKRYPLRQHGFARDLDFQLLEQGRSHCTFRLTDSPETHTHYPFAFELDISYRLKLNRLEVGYRLYNPADTALYASIGGHPAFIWPLDASLAKEEHRIEFKQSEAAPVRRLCNGVLREERLPSPLSGNQLILREQLFEDDAIVFDQLKSRQLRYSGPGSLSITLDFDDFPHLGIWSKPGADFICLEPWQGHASEEGFEGEFRDKTGVVELAAKEQRQWHYTIGVEE